MAQKLVTITLTALLDKRSPLCTRENIAGLIHSNLAVHALAQICDLHALPKGERSDLHEEILRIKKLEASLARDLTSSMGITLTDSGEPV